MWGNLTKAQEENGTQIPLHCDGSLKVARHQGPLTAEEAKSWAPTMCRDSVSRIRVPSDVSLFQVAPWTALGSETVPVEI